jgi:hypothetical protein
VSTPESPAICVRNSAGKSSPTAAITKRRSYRRTVTGTAWAALTQCRVAFTLRPSGLSPPRVAGSQVQRRAVISPAASFSTDVALEEARVAQPHLAARG